jgi:hypothetical protein
MSVVSLISMTDMQFMSLGEDWHTLGPIQKPSLSNLLNMILMDLRTLPYAKGSLVGGTVGEGHEGIRRYVRRSETPITSFEGFETFMFANPH